jgi:hypothetical protein
MSVRLRGSIVAGVVVILVALLIGVLAQTNAIQGTGTVRAVIATGSSDRLVDVAVVDASGREYAGDNRGAGQSETMQLIPAGRVHVNVGTCSTSANVRANQTVVVEFDPADCIS